MQNTLLGKQIKCLSVASRHGSIEEEGIENVGFPQRTRVRSMNKRGVACPQRKVLNLGLGLALHSSMRVGVRVKNKYSYLYPHLWHTSALCSVVGLKRTSSRRK